MTFDKVVALYDAMPDGADKTENKKHLGYLSHIASLANADISRWQILPSFGSGTGDNFLHDKNEINRIFFEKLKKNFNRKKEEDTGVKTSTVAGLDKLIDEYSTHTLKQKIAALERSANNYQAEARNAYALAEQQLSESQKYRREALALKSGEGELASKMRKELQEILALECWVNPIVDDRNKWLWLNTKNDVVLSYKNKAAGIDAEINAGKLAVQINFLNFAMRVFPYENNRQLIQRESIYYHPHISWDGVICWGNASAQVAESMPKGDFAKVLELLYSLLFNYHDDNPYVNIIAMRDNGGPLDYQNQQTWWRNMGYHFTHHPDVPKRLAEAKKAKEEAAKKEAEEKARIAQEAAAKISENLAQPATPQVVLQAEEIRQELNRVLPDPNRPVLDAIFEAEFDDGNEPLLDPEDDF